MRVAGLDVRAAELAVGAAFREVAAVHQLMSFHKPASDLSRLNASSAGSPVSVHSYTYHVLERALEISAATRGCFDITVGAELVTAQILPRLPKFASHESASWKDIELLPNNRIVLHRRACLDLGGIAKGFAVDRAALMLLSAGAESFVVNAGGDLRVHGPDPEWVALAAEVSGSGTPVLAVEQGSLASSGSRQLANSFADTRQNAYRDGVSRRPAPCNRFVSVLAEECLLADALTKAVMVEGLSCEPILEHFGAEAFLHDAGGDWHHLCPTRDRASIP